MISAWYKHLKSIEEQEQFKNQVLGCKVVFKRQQELLDELKTNFDNSELNSKNYDLPNWELRQADGIGYRRCLKEISKLINLDQEAK